eukprot:1911030-Lingulodinium_polyedra.AAC.1
MPILLRSAGRNRPTSCPRVASANSNMPPRGRHAPMAAQFSNALEAMPRLNPVPLAASSASSM